MDLDLQDLRVFLAVREHGSFGRAATALLVTQPAVSERIRRLERVLGHSVFERSVRGCELTSAGEALAPYADRCVALADEAVEHVRQTREATRLVVAVHSTFAARVVPLVLGALGPMPHRVEVRDAHSEVVPNLVLDGAAHVGFALAGPTHRGLLRSGLPVDPVVCVTRSGHRITRLRHPTLAQLAGEFIAANLWGDGASTFLRRASKAQVEAWRIRRCGDAATALALARHQDYVAFVTSSAVAALAGDLVVTPIDDLPKWSVRLDLLFRPADGDQPAIQRIRTALRTAGP